MPPDIDIYVLSPRRDRETLDRFLEEFAAPEGESSRVGEEIMILPLGAQSWPPDDGWDWEPAVSRDHMLRRGLEHPYRGFCVFFKPLRSTHTGVVIAFRADFGVVFGLTLDEARNPGGRDEEGKALIRHIAASYGGTAGIIAWDLPAPRFGAFPPLDVADQVVWVWPSPSA